MKSYLALAWKELKAQKITAILILVAVIMSTIMTTVIGQSIFHFIISYQQLAVGGAPPGKTRPDGPAPCVLLALL